MPSNSAGPDPHGTKQRLAQATAEYQRLTSFLSALGSELASLSAAVQTPYVRDEAALHVATNIPLLALPDANQALVRINLLGPFRLCIAGQTITRCLPGQVQTVLRFLASQGRHPVAKDALLDLLWPEADPSVAAGRLRVLMHTLRKTTLCDNVGFKDLVVMSGNNFLLNPEVSLWIDTQEFERHWHAGWRLARSGQTAEAMREYEQAEALYAGDYLEDEPYADWTLLRREALRDAYLTILTMLATMCLEAGDDTGAIIWSQKLLGQDNCREDAYRVLMISHHHIGQYGRAAYWYTLCVRTLARELGTEPSQETQALYAQLLRS